MDAPYVGLLEILEADQQNVEISKIEFTKIGITAFFEKLLYLLDVLRDDIAQHIEVSPSPFVRTSSGSVAIPQDLRLRFHMLNSAWNQFVFAASHLYRAQASEAYSHTRRAIEASGIAYLSKSKPDIGATYFSGDTHKLRNCTSKNKILPPEGITKELNALMDEASAQQHNNFISMMKRIDEEITDRGASAHYQYKSCVQDADNSMIHIWGASYHVLTSGYFVARLLAESFDIPAASWHEELQKYKAEIDKFNVPFVKAAKERTLD